MITAKPYVYKITFETGEYYYGYREKNKVSGEKDIGFKYFTSSKKVKAMFVFPHRIEILKEFDSTTAGDDAFDYEQKLIVESWGDPLLLNENARITTGNKRFKTKKGLLHGHYGKTWEEIFGVTKAKKIRSKRSNQYRGKNNPNFGNKWDSERKEFHKRLRFRSGRYGFGKTMRDVCRPKDMVKRRIQRLRGMNHPKADCDKYQFIHTTGAIEFCTRLELQNKYNLSRGNLSNVINGKKKSIKGWSLSRSDDNVLKII